MKQFFYKYMILVLWIPSYAEYLVYKTVNGVQQPITQEQEYEKVYSVLMNYQWPMVIGYASQMSKQELEEISAPVSGAEENFIRKKLKALSPEYDLVFVPTMFYELFVINWCEKHRNLLSNNLISVSAKKEYSILLDAMHTVQASSENTIDSDYIEKLTSNPSSTMQQLYAHFRQINNNILWRKAHCLINRVLFSTLINNDKKPLSSMVMRENVQRTVPQFVKDTGLLTPQKGDFNFLMYFSKPGVLENFIDFEYNAYNKNVAPLYRGGKNQAVYIVGNDGKKRIPVEAYFLARRNAEVNPSQERILKIYEEKSASIPWAPWYESEGVEQVPTGSISYGTTFLAGYFGDFGACAAYYFRKLDKASPPRIGYALFIDKKEFLMGNLNSLFYISLYNSLVSLFQKGEYFHSRSISYATSIYKDYFTINPMKEMVVEGFDILGSSTKFDKAGLFVRIGDPLQKVVELSEYIQHHAVVLKLSDSEDAYFPSANQTQSYFTAQKELTDMLKAMLTMRKHLYARLIKKDKKINASFTSPEALVQEVKNLIGAKEKKKLVTFKSYSPEQRTELSNQFASILENDKKLNRIANELALPNNTVQSHLQSLKEDIIKKPKAKPLSSDEKRAKAAEDALLDIQKFLRNVAQQKKQTEGKPFESPEALLQEVKKLIIAQNKKQPILFDSYSSMQRTELKNQFNSIIENEKKLNKIASEIGIASGMVRKHVMNLKENIEKD